MHIALLQFDLRIDHARSLKEKRRVVRSLKDRLHRDHLVAVAEVADHDIHNRASLAVTAVSHDARYLADLLDHLVRKVEQLDDAAPERIERAILDPRTLAAATDDDLWTEDERRDTETETARQPEPATRP